MNADAIDVTLFREILLVPFAIEPAKQRDAGVRSGRRLASALTAQLVAPWEPVPWRWLHLPEDQGRNGEALAEAYAEFVYFEPYVQRFLFGPRDEQVPAPIRLWRRQDVGAIDLVVHGRHAAEPLNFRLTVDRLNLYVFDTGNAILAVELRFDPAVARSINALRPKRPARERMSLADALVIHERIRRVFPPFFTPTSDGTGSYLGAPMFPVAFRPVARGAKPGSAADFSPEDAIRGTEVIQQVADRNVPPLHPAWLQLLSPLSIEGYERPGSVLLSQMGDDRAFAHLILGVDNAHDIERADWVRIAMADDPGDGYPYAEDFLADFEQRHCYDRFFQHGCADFSTRHLFSPYSYALVSSCAPPDRLGRDEFRDTYSNHGRRHYFQLALISYFQRTALLTLSERLSTALNLAGEDRANFYGACAAIEDDILRFTHRYWFEDISAQIQGQEIFDRFRDHLRTRALYDQITREVRQANEAHSAYEQAQIAHHQSRIAEEQLRIDRGTKMLNRTVFVGLIASTATGFLGMNVFVAENFSGWGWLWVILIPTACMLLFYLGLRLPIERLVPRDKKPE